MSSSTSRQLEAKHSARISGVRERTAEFTHAGDREPLPLPSSIATVGPGQSGILTLQRMIGNRATTAMLLGGSPTAPGPVLQAKLLLGAPNDRYEREADQVAERVMEMAEPQATQRPAISALPPDAPLQRQSADGEEKNLLGQQPVAPAAEARVAALRVGGQPLPGSERAFFEPRLGHDLGSVRVHSDAQAAHAADSLGAKAYTVGSDIVFGSGQYQPATYQGRLLLSHELAHVIQQGQASSVGQEHGSAPRQVLAAQGSAAAPAAVLQRKPKGAEPERKPAPQKRTTSSGRPLAAATARRAAAAIKQKRRPQRAAPVQAPRDQVPKTAGTAAEGPGSATASQSASGAELGGGRRDVKLLMPNPPAQLWSQAETAAQRAVAQGQRLAQAQADVPVPAQEVTDARAAVPNPTVSEDAGQRGGAVVKEQQPPDSPEVEAICQMIKETIRGGRQLSDAELAEIDFGKMAKQAGESQSEPLSGGASDAAHSYDEMKKAPQGQPGAKTELAETPAAAQTPAVETAQAVPAPVPAESLSLAADVQASEQTIDQAGMNTEPAQLVQDGPIADARAAQQELSALAQEQPAKAQAEQMALRAQKQADLADLAAQAHAALVAARAGHIARSQQQKAAMVGSEKLTRDQAGQLAQQLFTQAQQQVQTLLEPLPERAKQMLVEGIKTHSDEFKQRMARVKDWIDEHYSGVGGFLNNLGEAVGVLEFPRDIREAWDLAENEYIASMCALVRQVAQYVDTVIKACQQIIDDAGLRIEEVYSKLPKELSGWADEEKKKFGTQLHELHGQVDKARETFQRDLRQQSLMAVRDAKEVIQQVREAAKGPVGRIADAVTEFLKDPIKGIINGLLRLVGISPASFWATIDKISAALVDIAAHPLRFANNLMKGVGQGFDLFFANLPDRLIEGLMDWLFSGTGAVGVQRPRDFSLPSLLTLFLQVMGISWERIRKLLAEQIGPDNATLLMGSGAERWQQVRARLVKSLGAENVALLEEVVGLMTRLFELGPEGVYQLIKDKLNPEAILSMVIKAGVEYLVTQIIKSIALKLVMMLNPAGAILEAVKAIYSVVKWIFQNAARIFSLIEAIVNGISDVVAGNVSGMAQAVDRGLTKLIPIVIDFLAEFFNFTGLRDKVVGAIKDLQTWIEANVLRPVIGWLVDKVKKLLARLGLGGKPEPEGQQKPAAPGQIGETVSFGSGEESHKLWVKTQGSGATVMVASEPMTLAAWLADLEKKSDTLGEEARKKAPPLFAKARQLLAETDKDADKVAAAQASAAAPASGRSEGAPPPVSTSATNEEVKEDQHTLASVLQSLAELFGVELPVIVASGSMRGEAHTLTADPEAATVTMASRKGDAIAKVEYALAQIEELEETQKSKKAKERLTSIKSKLTDLRDTLKRRKSGSKPEGFSARELQAQCDAIMAEVSEYGAAHGVADIGELPVFYSDEEARTLATDVAKPRFKVLFDSWKDDIKSCSLTEKESSKKKIWTSFRLEEGPAREKALQLLQAEALSRWEHPDKKRPLNKTALEKALTDTSDGSVGEYFQQEAGGETAKQAKQHGEARIDEGRKSALEVISYENNAHYGRIRMPGDSERNPPLPPKIREKLVAVIKSTASFGAEQSEGEITVIFPKASELQEILDAALQESNPPYGDKIKSTLQWWKDNILSNEKHHIWPKWLLGEESPTVYLGLPRALHNFGSGVATGQGFHQVLNRKLIDELHFNTPPQPNINSEPADVKAWLAKVERPEQILSKLRKLLRETFLAILGEEDKDLLSSIRDVLNEQFKELEKSET